MERILLLSDINSSHTYKWITALDKAGFEVAVFGLGKKDEKLIYPQRVKIYSLEADRSAFRRADFLKLSFLKALPTIKRIIADFNPSVVHAHYATSYGTLAVLSRFKPVIVSVWGADIFDFPRKSVLHKGLIRYILRKAGYICSTSVVMAKETSKYTSKDIEVVPFGIDTEIFRPGRGKDIFDKESLVIGCVKTLEEKYGIRYLIEAFADLKARIPIPLKLLIVGGGSQEKELKDLCGSYGIAGDVVFTGFVNYTEVPVYHNTLDIAVYPSILNSESFGVAALESSSCCKPVIVSDVGGLPEVIEDGKTGLVVPPADSKALSAAIEKLILDKELREQYGRTGRERVIKNYSWDYCVNKMVEVYSRVLKNRRS